MPHIAYKRLGKTNRLVINPTPTPSSSPQPSSLGSTPLSPSPSTHNTGGPSTDQQIEGTNQQIQGNEPATPTSQIAPCFDSRTFISVQNKSFVPKTVANKLKLIVHSHFDGSYSSWTSIAPATKEHWWNKFKKTFKWDEDQSPEEVIRKVFNHVGSKHLKDIFQKARKDMDKEYQRPVWLKEDIWVKLVDIWNNDADFIKRSEVNKRNRAVATTKGLPVYKGGSISTTEHKKRLRKELGKEPSPKETFTKCYTGKDGFRPGPVAQQLVEKFDTLVDQATQDVAASDDEDGSNSVDRNLLWITATGGPKRGKKIFGMGSESHSMIQGTYSMDDEPINSSNSIRDIRAEIRDELREEIRSEFLDEFTNIRTEFGQRMDRMEQVETSLVEKVNQVHTSVGEKVDQLQQVQTRFGVTMGEMNKRLDNLVDKDTLFETVTRALDSHRGSKT